MANVPVRISRAIVQREGATGSFPPPVADTDPVITDPLNPPGSGAGPDTNKVSYNQPDNKSATEKQQARDNIDSLRRTQLTQQTITSNSTIDINANFDSNLVYRYELEANLTLRINTITNPNPITITIVVLQDSVGSRELNFGFGTGFQDILFQGGVNPIITDNPDEINVITLFWTGVELLGVKSCGYNV